VIGVKLERFSRRAKIVTASGLAFVLALAVVLIALLGGSSPSIESELSTYTHWCNPFTSDAQGALDVSGSANCGLSVIIFKLGRGIDPDQFGADNEGTGEWVAAPQASGLYLIRPALGDNAASAVAIMKTIPGSYLVDFSGATGTSAVAACNTDVKTVEVGVQAYYANYGAYPTTIGALDTGANAALRSWPSNNSYYFVGLVTATNTVSYINAAGSATTVTVAGATLGGVYVDAGNPVPAPGMAASWQNYDTYVIPGAGNICSLA
jgi:hypothetical protein